MSPHHPQPVLSDSPRRAGFTLLEILASLAIMALLTVAAMPAIGSLGSSGRFSAGVAELGDVLERAHAEALVRNTYVWVGLVNVPERHAVAVTVVQSRRGAISDLAQSEVSPLGKPVWLENMQLEAIPAGDLQNPQRETSGVTQFTDGDLEPESSDDHLEARIAGQTYRFDQLLQISPAGEVRVAPSRAAWVEIGLLPLPLPAKQRAVLQVNGVTGRVVSLQP